MLKSIKTSLKETIIYSLGNIAVKIVGLILIPLYTNPKFFSVEDFGILGILEIAGLVLTAFMASALPQSLIRWYWDKDFKSHQKEIFFMSFSVQVLVSLAFCFILIPFSDSFSRLMFSVKDWSRVVSLIIIASAIQSVNNMINTLMRLQSKSLLYSMSNLLKLTVVLTLTIYFIVKKSMGLEGIYLAQVIGNALTVILLIGYTVKNLKPFFNLNIFMSMNSYGFPLLLANISAVALTVIDRFTLNSLTVLKSVALYTLAFKITSVLKLVLVDSIKLAVGPMMIRRMDSPDNKRFYSKVLLYSSYILMFAIVAVSVFSYEGIKVLAEQKQFWGAVIIIPLLSFSIFFINMKEITVYGLHIAKKTRVIGFIVVFSAVLSLALNLLLIPEWDIIGSAIATLLSQLIYWLACYYFSQRVFYVPYEIRKILIIFFVGVTLSFSGLFFNTMDLLPRLLLKTVCVLSFPFILLLFRFYEERELQAIRGFFKKWGKPGNFRKNISSLKGLTDEI